MLFVEVATGTPKTQVQLKQENKHMSLPSSWTDATLEALGVARVTKTTAPDVGEWQVAVKDGVELVDGVWQEKWVTQEMFTEYTEEVTDEDGVTTTVTYTVQDQKDAKTAADLLAKRQGLSVTNENLRLQLDQIGVYGVMSAAVATLDATAEAEGVDVTPYAIHWGFATTINRLDEWVIEVAKAANITDEQLDELFENA